MSPSIPIVPCAPERSEARRRTQFRAALEACRAGTASLFVDLSEREYRSQVRPGYSPLGWHLGHIAFTEAMWLLHTAAGRDLPRPDLEPVYHVRGTAKARRGAVLPPRREACDYVRRVREAVLGVLETAPVARQERLWRFVLQHEAQHSETSTVIRSLWRERRTPPACDQADAAGPIELVGVPAGPAWLGNDTPDALDNEGAPGVAELRDFAIGRYPVTQAQFAVFMAAGGYDDPRWWSDAGWAWCRRHGVRGPLHWRADAPHHPVCGASAYEAEAFCAFHGLRLPSEAEWEKAAAWDPAAGAARIYPWGDTLGDGAPPCNWDRAHDGTTPVRAFPRGASAYGVHDLLGNVWEWTASPFAPYTGFTPWPYAGYSAAYFDGAHRVLRGGSWASRPWAVRNTFRNWYQPGMREPFAGFRVARDGLARR